jgi:5-methylcytosine-specific restriction endonuclease McrA
MEKKVFSRYHDKANDSFITKVKLYFFDKALKDGWHNLNLEDFRSFIIEPELLKTYTTEYWQYEPDYQITGSLTNDQIYRIIQHKETEFKDKIQEFRDDYIKNEFQRQFPPEKFEQLLKANECAYCGITLEMINDLAENQQLFKKNYRGWTFEVDRKNSNVEYTPDNCVMSCYWCNNAKTDEFSFEEFLDIGEVIRSVWDKRLQKQ